MIFSAYAITLIWLQNLSQKHGTFGINGAFFSHYTPTGFLSKRNDTLLRKKIKFKYKNIQLKKRMSSGSCLTSKLYDKIIKMPSKSHETIPLRTFTLKITCDRKKKIITLILTHRYGILLITLLEKKCYQAFLLKSLPFY
jgi:hypothetical protein